MRRLELDYVRAPAPARRAQGALLLLAAAFAADVGFHFVALRDSVAEQEFRLQRKSRAAGRGGEQPQLVRTAYSDSDFQAARDTIRRIALPWDELFLAIESARTEGTALLSIEPDADAGSVLLTGEAHDYLRILSYVSALSASPPLRNVHLLRHAMRAGDPQRALTFTVSATWSDRR